MTVYYVVLRGLVHSSHPDFEEARMTLKAYLAKHPDDVKRASVMRKTRYQEMRAERSKQLEFAL